MTPPVTIEALGLGGCVLASGIVNDIASTGSSAPGTPVSVELTRALTAEGQPGFLCSDPAAEFSQTMSTAYCDLFVTCYFEGVKIPEGFTEGCIERVRHSFFQLFLDWTSRRRKKLRRVWMESSASPAPKLSLSCLQTASGCLNARPVCTGKVSRKMARSVCRVSLVGRVIARSLRWQGTADVVKNPHFPAYPVSRHQAVGQVWFVTPTH